MNGSTHVTKIQLKLAALWHPGVQHNFEGTALREVPSRDHFPVKLVQNSGQDGQDCACNEVEVHKAHPAPRMRVSASLLPEG